METDILLYHARKSQELDERIDQFLNQASRTGRPDANEAGQLFGLLSSRAVTRLESSLDAGTAMDDHVSHALGEDRPRIARLEPQIPWLLARLRQHVGTHLASFNGMSQGEYFRLLLQSIQPASPRAEEGEERSPQSEKAGKGKKRGPKPDLETAQRVKEIVSSVAPDGNWKPKLEEICKALDAAKIPSPKLWKQDCVRDWASQSDDGKVVKAIKYRLHLAS